MKVSREQNELIKIGEVAREANLPVSTIRHYTRLGLLDVSSYTEGGQFLYERTRTVERLRYVEELSRRGMKLDDIRERYLVTEKNSAKKVLIIDDENQIDDLILRIIAKAHPGWEVRTTNNVFDAGHLLSDYLPHVVILDINLPAVTGYEICRYIKTTLILNKTKILAISGFSAEETREKSFACGADDFMPKPFNSDDLIRRVEKLLS